MGLEWRNDSHSGLVRYKATRTGPLFYPIHKAIAFLEQNLRAYLGFGQPPLIIQPQDEPRVSQAILR